MLSSRVRAEARACVARRAAGLAVAPLARSLSSSYARKRQEADKRVRELAEVQQRDLTEQWLRALAQQGAPVAGACAGSMSAADAEVVLKAAFASYLLHVEGRIASLLGEGFYTIGPCGEELMGVLGAVARASDPMALHYRHLAVQLARQFGAGGRPVSEVLLDRARGPTISRLDPVTGGHHCSLGGGPFDFYVSSTLASQTPPAVGRAMGIKLAPRLLGKGAGATRFPGDAVSIVSVGDGSVNNGMFLSAANLARYALHRSFKCPLLIVISNNDMCISLRSYGYLARFVEGLGLPVFSARGDGDMLGLWETTRAALGQVRASSRPAVLVVSDLPRRFGHAATDRQSMYLSAEEIAGVAARDPVRQACEQALAAGLVRRPAQLLEWWLELRAGVEAAFAQASAEPKISSRAQVLAKTSAPSAPVPARATARAAARAPLPEPERRRLSKPQPMRVLMTQCFKEALARDPAVVYVGEDVRHGGYYRVTDDLAAQFPERVQDVPPDETSVLGLAMGYSQAGLVPVCEMPYAKYLDCAADLFFEAVITHWCTAGRQKDGLVLRLQGFDKGVFGGNFHTHNSLLLPPGLDAVCFSNGRDYVRGMRHALWQAKTAGKVVMSVDSTDLLYRRSLADNEADTHWLHAYPHDDEEEKGESEASNSGMLDFETAVLYREPAEPGRYRYVGTSALPSSDKRALDDGAPPQLVILSYGNGVPTALRAADALRKERGLAVAVLDCPTLGRATQGMREVLRCYPDAALVFADVCKAGQHPFAGVTYELLQPGQEGEGRRPPLKGRRWHVVAAPPTYNPLGCTVTFLNEQDIIGAAHAALAPE
jgi:2-oxoisovalerate dehydrogenase E1 component